MVNSSSYSITELYVSPASSGSWGPDQLPSTIAPAGSFTVTNIPPGSYDLRAVASNGTTFWQTTSPVSITAGGLFTWTLTDPPQGQLRAVNNHCISITELYVSPASSGSWGPNQLASAIAPGGSFTVTAIPPGAYDVRAVAQDAVSWTVYGISITAGGTYTLNLNMPAGTGCLRVQNSTGVTIYTLYVTPSLLGCNNNIWGNDQLGTQTIANGSSHTVSSIPAGTYDFKADDVAIGGIVWQRCATSIVANTTYVWTLIP